MIIPTTKNAFDNIDSIIRKNYPALFEDPEVKIVDFVFWDCANNKEIPEKELVKVQEWINVHHCHDFSVVIYLNNNIIGYKLAV